MNRSVLAALVAVLIATGDAVPSSRAQTPPAATSPNVVRFLVVRTETDAGIIDDLLAAFRAQGRYQVVIDSGRDIYEQAREGKADLLLTHFRHAGLGAFVAEGLGLWPVTLMANVTAFLAPPDDPARIKGQTDSIEIFRRIAAAKRPFVVNGDPNSRYVLETLWHAAGRPDRQGWYMDIGVEGDAAAARAADLKGYTIWGITAIVESQKAHNRPLQMVIPTDSMMHRFMLTVAVNPAKFPARTINAEGAQALQNYLLSPEVQARILAFRYAGIDVPPFLAAGRNNENTVVEKVTPPVPAR